MQSEIEHLKNIANKFNVKGNLISIKPTGEGNVNNTLVAEFEENNNINRILIQKINVNVFQQPYKLMKNIENVTKYLDNKIKKSQESDRISTLHVIYTKDDSNMFVENDIEGQKSYWRAYEYIENTISYNSAENTEILYNAAKAFAHFVRELKDYKLEEVEITLPDYHNTPLKYKSLIRDVEKDVVKRAAQVEKEIAFVKARCENIFWLENLLSINEIPVRITHNDTKLNNVMIDENTGKPVCVIDLDTVMPSNICIDIGDGIRSGASSAFEDETDLSKVELRVDLFEAFLKGYFEEMGTVFTTQEVKHIVDSVKLITLELGIRFLNDYINGDTYFKIKYPDHNLDRAKNQFKLLQDIENKTEVLEDIVKNLYNEYK